MRTLVLGGIRSGKSQWAEAAVTRIAGDGVPVRYLATGPAADTDPSWAERVGAHQARRPAHWHTVETRELAEDLAESPDTATLVDDIGGWLTAVMDRVGAWTGAPVGPEADALVAAVAAFTAPLVLVTPEVGLTVVPATEAGRRFADELGSVNQRLAAVCDRVVLVVAGQPLTVKEPS
ncbi:MULTISPECIES: bifunctional adenosylcobinamide kinase/adenosylcobinamide-phosphate guanylyltransferase [Mycolicibacterium]|uniref:Adenosylcobinamide kinase n=1 Tax=Mycolicibacterium senegalense TaxID=1796 RepID=A0A378SZK6_9MYCO|nr:MULTISPECIES: bifunctional adenosylcobinamide kinase/adenosylcobinamide-phosphate guanylyltransferase [Mycolicibacterium]MCV7335410.1 bifunctional adenosylcobinamide kinase/adenosylcobinamide-phosphate guanylyltransferase [Mycolicibacterium senegalense]MDR7290636.1 adenosylcobinamide kinase/adenosylcobinamide-phosphate guanylyltransferase [Mycolicibacterium senegalense]QZA22207.1 bifunctional adenosylcobinamide kinase/adenosylcobinamide-phosphate guanylyltransferase [Mycolicibacterium senegal